MNHTEHEILVGQDENGAFIALSLTTPRFCVGAATQEEAVQKAERAVAYYHEAIKKVTPRIDKLTDQELERK